MSSPLVSSPVERVRGAGASPASLALFAFASLWALALNPARRRVGAALPLQVPVEDRDRDDLSRTEP